MLAADDFSLDGVLGVLPEASCIKGPSKGIKHSWLKAFETAPAQMLSAYGLAKYATMSNEDVSVTTVPLALQRQVSTTSLEYGPGICK